MLALVRTAFLIVLYLMCGMLLGSGLLGVIRAVVDFVGGSVSFGSALVAIAVSTLFCSLIWMAFSGLHALRSRWGIGFREPRVRRSTFDV